LGIILSSKDSRFILDRVRDNISPIVPVEGMNEWLELFTDTYIRDTECTTFDPLIRRSAKIYAYWSLLDSMTPVDAQEFEEIESLRRSINNELAWAFTLTLEVMPNLNIDSGRLQTQVYFDLFKDILKNNIPILKDTASYFDEELVTFSFSHNKKIDDIENRVFETLLFDIADQIFNVDAEIFLEISDALRSLQTMSDIFRSFEIKN
jgi:hypothetical protein